MTEFSVRPIKFLAILDQDEEYCKYPLKISWSSSKIHLILYLKSTHPFWHLDWGYWTTALCTAFPNGLQCSRHKATTCKAHCSWPIPKASHPHHLTRDLNNIQLVPFLRPGLRILVHLCKHCIALRPSIISLMMRQLFSPYSTWVLWYLRSIFAISHPLLVSIDPPFFCHCHNQRWVTVDCASSYRSSSWTCPRIYLYIIIFFKPLDMVFCLVFVFIIFIRFWMLYRMT